MDKWLRWLRTLKEPQLAKVERPTNMSRRGFLRAIGVTTSGIVLGSNLPNVEEVYGVPRLQSVYAAITLRKEDWIKTDSRVIIGVGERLRKLMEGQILQKYQVSIEIACRKPSANGVISQG